MGERLVVGFGHKRRRGKDLCGDLAMKLLAAKGIPARRDWFAYTLKEMCRTVFGFDDAQLYGDRKFEPDPFWGITPRRALQLAGTESMRNVFREDIWVKTVEQRALRDPNTSVIICDVRFPNEVEGIHRLGGVCVRVDRPTDQIPPATAEGEDQHASETSLDGFEGWDFVVQNDAGIAELERRVDFVLAATMGCFVR